MNSQLHGYTLDNDDAAGFPETATRVPYRPRLVLRWCALAVPGLLVAGTCGAGSDEVFANGFESSVFSAPPPDLLVFDGVFPDPDPDGASFRIKCDVSHGNYDDPIVFPGLQDHSHLHIYLGNTEVDYATTEASLVATGDSTCQGGHLNRSAYWTPAVLAPQFGPGGEPLLDAHGNSLLEVVTPTAFAVPESQADIYYKAAVDDLESIQAMPAGLRMIAGRATANPSQPQELRVVRWSCSSTPIMGIDDFSEHIPACEIGDVVNLSLTFPSCWTGVALDAPDHASHMAYSEALPDGNGGFTLTCPPTHPVRLAEVSYNFGFPVTAANANPSGDSGSWRVASDAYDTRIDPGGYSFHGDWFMAWHPEIAETWARDCLRAGRHCAGGALGNGWRLLGPFPGSGDIPPPVHCGMGPSMPMHADC